MRAKIPGMTEPRRRSKRLRGKEEAAEEKEGGGGEEAAAGGEERRKRGRPAEPEPRGGKGRRAIEVPEEYCLRRVVKSYGFSDLAPNVWDEERGELSRPLHGVVARVTQPGGEGAPLAVRLEGPAAGACLAEAGVRRMLRVDERLDDFWAVHKEARGSRFGRIFRSPSLFEDLCKTLTTVNVQWGGTRAMNAALCEHFGGPLGEFPSAAALAAAGEEALRARCRMGYRAPRLARLAASVASGEVDLEWLERGARTTAEVVEFVRALPGFGPYASSTAAFLLARYAAVPCDSVTVALFRGRVGAGKKPDQIMAAARAHYERYHPFQALAYWFDVHRKASSDK